MITVAICLAGILLFWRNREQAGCWVVGVFILIFLFLAAGATVPLDTLRDVNDRLDRINVQMMREERDRAQRGYEQMRQMGSRP